MAKNDEVQLSTVAAFDDLMRHCSVLTAGCEDEFLQVVVKSKVSRQRGEQAEVECQRLTRELTKCYQDISSLKQKVQHSRVMFNTEQHLRKKAETERDQLASQMDVFRQLVMETDNKMDKEVTFHNISRLIKGIEKCGVRSSSSILSSLTREEARADTTVSRTGESRSGMMVGENENRSHSVGINKDIEVLEEETMGRGIREEENMNKNLGQEKERVHILVEKTGTCVIPSPSKVSIHPPCFPAHHTQQEGDHRFFDDPIIHDILKFSKPNYL
eukprot:GFUD01117352.1.p1 GENE.GFUD01117352.1~~GFUD01117352.1.p1  ORF type:complete len:273 (-),score=101.91 GFUD01117352.1:73-891(-)